LRVGLTFNEWDCKRVWESSVLIRRGRMGRDPMLQASTCEEPRERDRLRGGSPSEVELEVLLGKRVGERLGRASESLALDDLSEGRWLDRPGSLPVSLLLVTQREDRRIDIRRRSRRRPWFGDSLRGRAGSRPSRSPRSDSRRSRRSAVGRIVCACEEASEGWQSRLDGISDQVSANKRGGTHSNCWPTELSEML
jgi:hypothetical protein